MQGRLGDHLSGSPELNFLKMKGFCRVCASDLQGNQRRWIFHTSGRRRLQIILSYILGYTISRDGQGEFLCSKCAFMLEKALEYDIVIARVKTVANERLQMLTAEKEQLIQCIVYLYFQCNEKSKISQHKERISTQGVNPFSVQYSMLLQDESVISEFWTPGRSSKKNLRCSNCWRTFSGGHRTRICLCSESVRVAGLFCDLVCSTPRRTTRSGLKGSVHQSLLSSQSQSLCFDLRSPIVARKLPSPAHSGQSVYTDSLEIESMPTLNSTRIDWITDEESEQVQLKSISMFDCTVPTENFPLRQSIANAIQEIKDIKYKPVPSLAKSKIPKHVKFTGRRPASRCNIAVSLQEPCNRNSTTSGKAMWTDLEDDYTSLKTEVVGASNVKLSVWALQNLYLKLITTPFTCQY
ncbi:uncharacterized protein LOC144503024 [Mustelus asterias]